MKFAYLKGWNRGDAEWWEWIPETMQLCNFMGGGFDINENADYWMNAEIHEFESWHHLYQLKGFNPLEVDIHNYDVWISPDGKYFEGEAHAVAAEYICKLVYGIDVDDPACTDAAEYYLEQKHWIKATRGYMWNIYLKHRDSWEMTGATYGALVRYCDFHQLGIPKGVVIIRGN